MKKILTLGLISALFVSTAGCVQKGGDNTTTTGGGDTGVIKIGVYGDLTGQTASFGQSTKNGIELAAAEINAAGGINGRKIQLVVEDDRGRPEEAKTVVSKLINSDKVVAVLGEVASTNSLAAAPVAQEAKVPMITPSSTNPKVTQVGDYIFRVCFLDDFQGSSMAKFASKNLNAKTAAIFGDVNSDYSKGLTEFFKGEFTKAGGQVVIEKNYTQTDADFKGQLTAIRDAKPDVIYVPGYYSQVGIIAKQARELGMTMPLLGGDGWDSPQLWELGGDSLKNSFITNHYSVDDPAENIQKFVAAYKAKFNTAPDSLAALAYDAMNILADSIKRAGGTDSAKLRDAIAATTNFNAITGTITINKKRDADKSAVVLEVKPETKQLLPREKMKPEGEAAPTTASPTSNAVNNNSNAAAVTNTNAAPTNANAAGAK